MPGTAIVTIGEHQWSTSLATTMIEHSSGLGNTEVIPENTGMLFDMGNNTDISVTTEPMLFNIDIIFIKCEYTDGGTLCHVDSIIHDAPPGNSYSGEGRYFLEVNGGEASDVEIGDNVEIAITIEEDIIADLVSLLMLAAPIIVVAGVLSAGKAVRKFRNR